MFYNQVNHKAPWDIKRPESWETTIKTSYPGFDSIVIFDGLSMTPEDLGNFTYGFLGYFYDIPYDVLVYGSYYAAGFPLEGPALENEGIDWIYISFGYEYAKNQLLSQGK